MNPYSHADYFEWLCNIVGADQMGQFCQYRNLLTRLFQTPFYINRPMDDNRASNGVLLRYYFETNRYDYASNDVAPYHFEGNFYEETKNEPCSLLEMLISFAKQIDTQYLHSNTPRIFVWFWIMIESMGLANMFDNYWVPEDPNSEVEMILEAFNKNAIEYRDGYFTPTVLLFPIRDIYRYQNLTTLWDQLQVWFNQNEQSLESLNPGQFIENFMRNHERI